MKNTDFKVGDIVGRWLGEFFTVVGHSPKKVRVKLLGGDPGSIYLVMPDGLHVASAAERRAIKLAERIVALLFTNGSGLIADRLRLVTKEGNDLGSWAEFAVMGEIIRILLEA